MKHLYALITALLLAQAVVLRSEDFCDGRRFRPGDVAGAEAVNFDDATWEPVTLPHPAESL